MIANLTTPTAPGIFENPVIWSKADLHIHTIFSDGYMPPAATIAEIARAARVNVVTITDHDTIDGALIAHN